MIKKAKKKKDTVFYLDRCKFYTDTNNLIDISMMRTIIQKFDDATITHLNQIISGIKFYIGGKHRHYDQNGYYGSECFEIDFHERRLLIFLAPIFRLGEVRWKEIQYGALKRYVWESFCHEIIMCLITATRINLELVNEAKNFNFNSFRNETRNFYRRLLENESTIIPRVNFISINNTLWKEPLPKKFGFIQVLYSRKINELKTTHGSNSTSSFYDNIKLYNELRKIKMKYEYEYNLSELVNYCIHNDRFEEFFKGNWRNSSNIHREFYYKAKRIILKFFKQYDIELKKYKDSANRTHLFITHEIFERVKSACLQLCIQNLQSKYLNEYLKYKDFYIMCPICKTEDNNHENQQKFFFSPKHRYFKEMLIEGMNNAQNLEELNSEEFYFGIPCNDCYFIVRNISGKYSELDLVQKFTIFYGTCPICGIRNHTDYLLSFYYDDNRKELKDTLVRNMIITNNFKKFNMTLGIPCCTCFEEVFQENPMVSFILDTF